MEKLELNFTTKENIVRQNSFGIIDAAENIELEVTIGYNPKNSYGYFEFYDVESGGEEWYAEGGLWFSERELTEYDGVFSLPNFIITALEENGFDCSYAK
jgi:hypothetical protein